MPMLRSDNREGKQGAYYQPLRGVFEGLEKEGCIYKGEMVVKDKLS